MENNLQTESEICCGQDLVLLPTIFEDNYGNRVEKKDFVN